MTQVYRSPNYQTDISGSQQQMHLLRIEQDKLDKKQDKRNKGVVDIGSSAWKMYTDNEAVETSNLLSETFDIDHGGGVRESLKVYERDPVYTNKSFWKKPFTPSGGRVKLTDKYTKAHTFTDKITDYDPEYIKGLSAEKAQVIQDKILSGDYLHHGAKPEGYIGKWGTENVEGAESLKDVWSSWKEGFDKTTKVSSLKDFSTSIKDIGSNVTSKVKDYGLKASDLGTGAGKIGAGLEIAGDIWELSDDKKRKKMTPGQSLIKAAKYAKYVPAGPFTPITQGIGWGASLLDMVV